MWFVRRDRYRHPVSADHLPARPATFSATGRSRILFSSSHNGRRAWNLFRERYRNGSSADRPFGTGPSVCVCVFSARPRYPTATEQTANALTLNATIYTNKTVNGYQKMNKQKQVNRTNRLGNFFFFKCFFVYFVLIRNEFGATCSRYRRHHRRPETIELTRSWSNWIAVTSRRLR